MTRRKNGEKVSVVRGGCMRCEVPSLAERVISNEKGTSDRISKARTTKIPLKEREVALENNTLGRRKRG